MAKTTANAPSSRAYPPAAIRSMARSRQSDCRYRLQGAGDAIARIEPPATRRPANFKFTTGAYPNQLNNLGIHGHFVYVPNTGASPNGRFAST